MEREYLRDNVLEYAYDWAYKRNSSYYDYDALGRDCTKQVGDFVQLRFSGNVFAHTLLVTKVVGDDIYVTTHTFDNLNKLLDSYFYENIRFVHIDKVIF